MRDNHLIDRLKGRASAARNDGDEQLYSDLQKGIAALKADFGLPEIVMKLVGSIEPEGESNGDARRFQNLQTLTSLVDTLIREIQYVSRSSISHESSVKNAGDYAKAFLRGLAGDLEDYQQRGEG